MIDASPWRPAVYEIHRWMQTRGGVWENLGSVDMIVILVLDVCQK